MGKTTYAKTLIDHDYYCFDALFPWHDIETLCLSTEEALKYVKSCCIGEKFVLDGWHLADSEGKLFPTQSVHVVYAPYSQIISQYRVSVERYDQHKIMFKKWYYDIDYSLFEHCVFVLNTGEVFKETNIGEFRNFLNSEI